MWRGWHGQGWRPEQLGPVFPPQQAAGRRGRRRELRVHRACSDTQVRRAGGCVRAVAGGIDGCVQSLAMHGLAAASKARTALCAAAASLPPPSKWSISARRCCCTLRRCIPEADEEQQGVGTAGNASCWSTGPLMCLPTLGCACCPPPCCPPCRCRCQPPVFHWHLPAKWCYTAYYLVWHSRGFSS